MDYSCFSSRPAVCADSVNNMTATLPDFFAARSSDKNGILRVILTVIILIFMISYVSAQFVAGDLPGLKSYLYELIHAFFLSLTVTILVSKLISQAAEVVTKFEAMKSINQLK